MTLFAIKMSNNHELVVEADTSAEAYDFALQQYMGSSVTSLAIVPSVSARQKEVEETDEE